MAEKDGRIERGNVMILGQKRRLVKINIRFVEPENEVHMGELGGSVKGVEVKILGQKRRLV